MSHVSTGHTSYYLSTEEVIEDPTTREKQQRQRNEIVIKRIHKAPSVLGCYKTEQPLKLLTEI